MTGYIYEFGEFRFATATRELLRMGRRVELPRRTFECLECLLAHRDRALHRDELVAAIFGRPNVSDAQLGQVVLRTRRALGDDGNAQRMIRTVAGFGYRWVATVDRVVENPAGELAHAAAMHDEVQAPPAAAPAPAPVAGPACDAATAARTRVDARRLRVRVAMAIVTACAFAAMIASLLLRTDQRMAVSGPRASAGDRVAVLPIDVDGLRADAWLRLGAMDLVAERLREGGFGVPPSENVIGVLQASAARDADADIALRSATAARLVVRGKATRGARGWKVELAALPAQGVAVPVTFAAADAIEAVRGATDLLLAALGRSSPNHREGDAALDETLQRARAAMLANELDTARSILLESAALAARPDQLAYRLARVDFRAGRLDAVESSLSRLLDRPAARSDPHFRAQVLIARGATRTRRGAFADGGRDYAAALALLGTDGAAQQRGDARQGRANSFVAAHRYADALADFGAARIELEAAGDVLGVARVDANLGMLELDRGRPAAALGYLPGAADRFQSFGALHELLITLTGLVEARLAMLERDEAVAAVERAWTLRERITDPDQRVDLLLDRAQVSIGAGRYSEADAALEQADGMTTSGNRVLRARLRALQAELAVRRARWSEADVATSRALADWPGAGADGDRATILRLRQHALIALGQDELARTLFERARDAPATAAAGPGHVAEALAMAEWATHEHDPARAADWFRFAMASAEHGGVPSEIVAVADAQAPLLLNAGMRDAAAAMIGRVAPWAAHDFDCALLQVRLYRALGQRDAWFAALRQAQALAGERTISPALMRWDGA